MDYQERQAAGASGRVRRDSDDYLDLGRLLVFFLPTAFAVVWSVWYPAEFSASVRLGLLTLIAITLWAVIVCYQSGKLEVVSEKLIPLQKLRVDLKELGYKVDFGNEYYTRFIRKLSRFGPSICVEIFNYEEKHLGHAWMTFGYSWKRMPFVTGRSQIRAIRDKLSASHSTAPTKSSSEMRKRLTRSNASAGVASHYSPKWRKRK